MLRAKNYALAYKALSVKDWNSYVSFGIQQFVSPSSYLEYRNTETPDEKNLRIARYYRLHLENDAPIDRHLMKVIVDVETALQLSHPGFFALSLVEMDEYILQLPAPDSIMEIEPENPSAKSSTSVSSPVLTADSVTVVVETPHPSSQCAPLNHGDDASKPKSALKKTVLFDQTSESPTVLTGPPSPSDCVAPLVSGGDISSFSMPVKKQSISTKKAIKIPQKVTNSIRVEVRWAPKDFQALKASTAQMYLRLAPLLSAFNSPHSWVVEWQTDQLATSQILDPATLSKFLSIRVIPSIKQKCFFFSFRVNATGSQFTQVAQSAVLHDIKKGENI